VSIFVHNLALYAINPVNEHLDCAGACLVIKLHKFEMGLHRPVASVRLLRLSAVGGIEGVNHRGCSEVGLRRVVSLLGILAQNDF
jgi:hypothetical protein